MNSRTIAAIAAVAMLGAVNTTSAHAFTELVGDMILAYRAAPPAAATAPVNAKRPVAPRQANATEPEVDFSGWMRQFRSGKR